MNLIPAKRIIYGLCGGLCILAALMCLAADSMSTVFAHPMEEALGMDTPKYAFSFDILTFGLPGVLLLVITLTHTKILAIPAKSKYLFVAAAALVCLRLLLDVMNPSQGFHAGHVLLLLALAALVHDTIVSHRRGSLLAKIKWR